MSDSNKPRKIYYLSSTHWDREWYQSFQKFRLLLKERIDEVIETLENDPDFTTFMTDGQVSLLDDYLEVAPEMKARLLSLMKKGRIAVGPFYTLPDQYLVGGESFVRNLLLGHRRAAEWGVPALKYGYLCDIFGHVAQMPQILNGFGIEAALIGRGTNAYECPAHFVWRGVSGHSVITFKVPETTGYGSFWYDVLYQGSGDQDQLRRAITYVEEETKRSDVPYVVLMDGMDHMGINKRATSLARRMSEALDCPVVFEPLTNMVQDVLPYKDHLPVFDGELNKTGRDMVEHHKLIAGTLSSRYDLKRANDDCQNILYQWAEPLAAAEFVRSGKRYKEFLDIAARYLVLNHAHDSICGCSLDIVHRDMLYRLRQASEIADGLSFSVLSGAVGGRMPTGKDFQGMSLWIYNGGTTRHRGVAEAEIAFPVDYPNTYCNHMPFETINAFVLQDPEGREVPYQILSVKREMVQMPGQLFAAWANVYRVALEADVEGGCGLWYAIVPREHPTRYPGTMRCGGNRCENEFLCLTVEHDGTVAVFDKATGKEYRNLGSYEDSADIGDGWNYIAPVNDQRVLSAGAPCTIKVEADGENLCAFSVTHQMNVPERYEWNRSTGARSDKCVALSIKTTYTLKRTARFVEVRTEVDNHAEDHRLRLRLPTYTGSPDYTASQPYCFVDRAVGFDKGTAFWKEMDSEERGFDGIVLRRGEDGSGLAFVSASGLHECACSEDPKSSMYITLYRCFRNVHMDTESFDGQLKQPLEFNYRLVPMGPETRHGELAQMQADMRTGLRFFTTAPTENAGEDCVGLLNTDARDLVITAVKPPEDTEARTAVMRICNYSAESAGADIITHLPLEQAVFCNMLEVPLGESPIEIGEKGFRVELAPHQIATIRMRFGE